MDVDDKIKELKNEEQRRQVHPFCYCWPADASSSAFWGGVLVVVGSIWLLSNLGFAAAFVWPLFFIGLGLFYLNQAREKRDR